MPVDCDRCGGVLDWGDFGPDPDDPLAGTTCSCDPEPDLVGWLREQSQMHRRMADEHLGDSHQYCRHTSRAAAYEHVIEHLNDVAQGRYP